MISANFTDGTVAFADVEVIVEDVNDVCPKFTSSEFVVYHTEPMAKDLLVALTTINDVDTVGTIVYSLSGGGDKFRIDQQGRVFTNNLVNDNVTRIEQVEYSLSVLVNDGRCVDNTKIRVVARKILVDLYRFNEPYYRYVIGEEQTLPFIIDEFTNKGGFPAKYYLMETNPAFQMNATTGKLVVKILFV